MTPRPLLRLLLPRADIGRDVLAVLRNGNLDLGPKVEEFERTLPNEKQREQSSKINPDDLTLLQIWRAMRPAHVWAIGTAIFTLLGTVASGAFWLGTKVSESHRPPGQTQKAK